MHGGGAHHRGASTDCMLVGVPLFARSRRCKLTSGLSANGRSIYLVSLSQISRVLLEGNRALLSLGRYVFRLFLYVRLTRGCAR